MLLSCFIIYWLSSSINKLYYDLALSDTTFFGVGIKQNLYLSCLNIVISPSCSCYEEGGIFYTEIVSLMVHS